MSSASSAHSHSPWQGSSAHAFAGMASHALQQGSRRRDGSDGDRYDDGASANAPAKARKRSPASCVNCRTKKLRCNRMSPCSACTSRGIDCEWVDCAPLLVQREANDTGELRAQIDRLQQIVEKLAAQSAASSQPGSSAGRSQTRPPLQRHASSSSASTSPGSEIITPPLEAGIEVVRRSSGRPSLTWQDIRANDLTEHLTQLAITHIGGQHSGPKATNELVNEAKKSCLAGVGQLLGSSKQFSVPMPDFEQSDAKPTNILRPPKRTLADLLIIQSTLGYHATYLDWYLHFIHDAVLREKLQQLQQAVSVSDLDNVDLAFLSLIFTLCAQSLAMMPTGRAVRDGFVLATRDALVQTWLDCASDALHLADFLIAPTEDTIRGMVALGAYHVFLAPGDSCGAGMKLLALASQLSQTINMHRDPDRFLGEYDALQAEDRRRLFWQLHAFMELASSSIGSTWPMPSSAHVDTKLPADVDDVDITRERVTLRPEGEETLMTSVIARIKIGQLSRRITDRVFGLDAVPYKAVLDADAELNELERSIHPRYRLQWRNGNVHFGKQPIVLSLKALNIHIALQQERLRIHRPFLVRGKGYERSRAACLEAASTLLAIHRSPFMRAACFGGLTYKTIAAATCLAIDLLQSHGSDSFDATAVAHRDEVVHALELLDQYADVSGVARKGARLLRFLLDKDRQVEEQRLDRSQAKRPRQPTDPQSQLARALAPPTLAQFAPTPPEDVSLPHKRKTSTKSSASSMLRTPTEPSFSFEPPPIPIPAPAPIPRVRMPPPPPLDVPPAQQPFYSVPTFEFEARYDYGLPTPYTAYPGPAMMAKGWRPPGWGGAENGAGEPDPRYPPVWQPGVWPSM